MMYRLILAVGFVALNAATGASQTQKAPQPPATTEPALLAYPWHMACAAAQLGVVDIAFETFEVDLHVVNELPADQNWFVAVNVVINNTLAYLGTATGLASMHPDRPEEIDRRPGLIFSRWQSSNKGDTWAPGGGYAVAYGHEGNHVGTRLPVDLRKGLLTIRFTRMDPGAGDAANVWLAGFVIDHTTGREHFAGALRFPGRRLILNRQPTCFVERFGTLAGERPTAVPRMPDLRVAVGNWRVDGKRIDPIATSTTYVKPVPPLGKGFVWQHAAGRFQAAVAPSLRRDGTMIMVVGNTEWSRRYAEEYRLPWYPDYGVNDAVKEHFRHKLIEHHTGHMVVTPGPVPAAKPAEVPPPTAVRLPNGWPGTSH